MQPQLRIAHFKDNSYILIEGNETNSSFYIIKDGEVKVTRSVDKITNSNGELLKPGDFFGVISAMSGQPATETAIAMTNVNLLEVPSNQFDYLIKQSAPLAMKIIRYFSKKLRFFDHLLTQLSARKQGDEESDVSKLFELAEYYFNNGAMSLALYAYQRYIDLVPNGDKINEAKQKLERYEGLKSSAFNPTQNITGFNRKYKPDTFIFCEHEPGNELHIIQQGKVKITKILGGREVLLAVLKNGDIFGEMSILENKPRSASAIAYGGEVVTLAVNKENFSNMVVEQPKLATRLITILSDRIWSIYRQIKNILIADPVVRTLDTLLTIVLKEKVPIKRGEKFIFEFGVKELINMLGLPYGEGKLFVNEALSDTRLFKIEESRIICNDIDELAKIVNAQLKKLEILKKAKQR
ncbi:MAG TPA: cyclic nucleotide-binding domain-containing protein [Spirochaetota bacterium]|nr:cyclic nucleotide-binding domain-containing protein [Spirochaetota bacterium]HOM37979.1 cyclic nucleotide-binding domain-containing protein [Spirochaetota bacterium]HPQ48784.1 cyclic nucleotide-binding domain-containing protein [Spirochaetota bacterium]